MWASIIIPMIKHQVAGASEKKTIKLQEKIKLLYYAKKKQRPWLHKACWCIYCQENSKSTILKNKEEIREQYQ